MQTNSSALLPIYYLVYQHLTFSSEFIAAVEAKQVAQQEAQRAAFAVDNVRQ
jgi:hypothetical protein